MPNKSRCIFLCGSGNILHLRLLDDV